MRISSISIWPIKAREVTVAQIAGVDLPTTAAVFVGVSVDRVEGDLTQPEMMFLEMSEDLFICREMKRGLFPSLKGLVLER